MFKKEKSIITYLITFIIFNLTCHQNIQAQTITKEELDLSPEIIEGSPVLQQWLEEIPDVLNKIKTDPSFKTRFRVGYAQFPSTDHQSGLNIGVEDLFLGKSGLTLSGDYETSFKGDPAGRTSVGANLAYYLLPLGNNINIAPVVGYRYLQSEDYSTDGVNVGLKLMFAFSRSGAGDISLTQSFISPGSNEEVGVTSVSVGYAITEKLRLAADIKKENSRAEKDSRVGIVLEIMPF